jgi:hypothetical protein
MDETEDQFDICIGNCREGTMIAVILHYCISNLSFYTLTFESRSPEEILKQPISKMPVSGVERLIATYIWKRRI